MLSRIVAITTLVAFVILSALMHTTSPSTIHPIGILLVFILFYLLALGMLAFFIFWAWNAVLGFKKKNRLEQSFPFREAYYYASVLALAPVLLVGMRSIGRGSMWDVLLVIIFEVVACFYITKRK